MQKSEVQTLSPWRTGLMLAALLAVVVGLLGLAWWAWIGEPISREEWQDFLLIGLLCWALGCVVTLLAWWVTRRGIKVLVARARAAEPSGGAQQDQSKDIREQLRNDHGRFWQQRVRIYLVTGEEPQIEAFAPGLSKARWLAADGVVLLCCGSLQATLDPARITLWTRVRRRCGFDGLIWVANQAQLDDAAAVSGAARRLQVVAQRLGWQLPVHLWHICHSDRAQAAVPVQPVGCVLPEQVTEAQLIISMGQLQHRLLQRGVGQVAKAFANDFLLTLSRELRGEGLGRWRSLCSAVGTKRGLSLRGIWFSLPVLKPEDKEAEWLPGPAWSSALIEQPGRPRRLGWGPVRMGYVALLAVFGVWGAGLMMSFATNRAETARLHAALLDTQRATERSDALTTLTHELSRLDYRLEHGAPWHHRFGLDHTRALYHSAWPAYARISAQLLREPAAARLHQQLSALIALPPGSPERARRAQQGYAQLKAYLMLTHPAKTDADFLASTLGDRDPAAWAFQARHLAANPGWAIEPDRRLIAQTRQVLLGQLGQRNGETTLYRQALAAAANHYPALGLQQMVGETDASALFSNPSSVPGVFTREAWEGHVRKAIDEAARARREEIDWVLSDSPGDIAAELSPDALRERLTQRYFDDYGRAWLDFLNRTRWRSEDGLEAVIGQLSLISDARQSPLIALLNTLAYQGQAGMRGQALAESLLKSAQNLVGREVPERVVETLPDIPAGPLDPTFGPLLALLGKAPQARPEELSLQRYLTQVTGVRLKLQQVANAADPQAMTQALAQTVFQGRQVELTDTRAYANLVAASLGAEWAPAAQALFVQPLEQAWQRVLQPSAASLNRHWQGAVVDDWNAAFNGRYPFAATGSDSSLPMLGQMIRADSGRIEAFMREQLAGLVHKEGSRWLATPGQGQGLRLNPRFLDAVNQLSELADVLYTDGGMGIGFELRGKPVRDVVQTRFTLDGEQHHYFNQRERWQRFRWPGQGDRPGTSLTWSSVHGGERLLADHQGVWGLIRLLEQAQVTPLDDRESRFEVVLKAPDGLGLTWHLRTELGEGPLALLKLRSFALPKDIFLQEGADDIAQR